MFSIKGTPFTAPVDLNTPSYHHVSHALSQGGESVQIEFDLLSLPLYMIEELPRIFGDIVANDDRRQGKPFAT